jgi:transcriptional regulator with XRE-family HTH domain
MDQTANQRVAANLRAEVARQRISQTTLGERLGLSQAGVSRRLLGQVPIAVDELAAFAEVLGVQPETMLGAPVVAAS